MNPSELDFLKEIEAKVNEIYKLSLPDVHNPGRVGQIENISFTLLKRIQRVTKPVVAKPGVASAISIAPEHRRSELAPTKAKKKK